MSDYECKTFTRLHVQNNQKCIIEGGYHNISASKQKESVVDIHCIRISLHPNKSQQVEL